MKSDKLKTGDLGLLENTSTSGARGFLAKSIKFFTKSKWTHGFMYMGNVVGVPSILEADNAMVVVPASTLEKSNYSYKIFRYNKISEEQALYASQVIYKNLSGKAYGFLQLLYFIRRWFWEKEWVKKYLMWIPRLLGKPADPRLWNNWFVSGIICTEHIWILLYEYAQLARDSELVLWLEQWNSNNFAPHDFEKTLIYFKEKFDLIMEF